jgi:hypothetical protein
MPSLIATFIGINAYPRNPLSGCVTDVMNMDRLLRELSAQQDDLTYEPLYLVAPHDDDDRFSVHQKEMYIADDRVLKPTFEAVKSRAFAHLKKATDGDVCMFYYSGHGSHAEAPPEFWHTKPDRQNETLVCVDSRDPQAPAARDLLDKELAYLLWDALGGDRGKNVHCLVIMDCCHAGNNTRAAALNDDGGLRYRHAPASKNKIPLNQYEGYKEGFYNIANEKAEITIANYVHLAAARDAEQAQETVKGGLFTRKLVEALRQGGTTKSYRELVQNLTVAVNGEATSQNPVAYARNNADLDLTFLGRGIRPFRPSFEVQYDSGLQRWILFGGALHGIAPFTNNAQTTVTIKGLQGEVEVKDVYPQTSLLDDAAMVNADTSKMYQAFISRRANPTVTISLSKALAENAVQRQALKTEYEKASPLYFRIDFEGEKNECAYLIRLSEEGEYMLTKRESERALFKREINAANFLNDVESVCKWVSVRDLKNKDTNFSSEHFEFIVERLEGKELKRANISEWDKLKGDQKLTQPEEETVLRYVDGKQPAFRFNVAIKDPDLQKCFVGALYLDPLYGIDTTLIDTAATAVKDGNPLYLKWNANGKDYTTIPLRLDNGFKERGINEVTVYLKIFVANQPIDLIRYRQEPLKLDQLRAAIRSKSIGLDSTESNDDWTVFTFPIRIVGPKKDKAIQGGTATDFGAFTIEAPPSFTANAYAATCSDVQARLRTLNDKNRETKGRGADEEAVVLSQMLLPPDSIWGEDVIAEAAFATEMSTTSDNGIQVLELKAANGVSLQLAQGTEIKIKPKERTRSLGADGLQETVVPFGYDDATQLYFPLGYSDANGDIHIQTLPPPTTGIINSNEQLSRSIGSSVKLFFKKLFRKGTVNTLAMYSFKDGQPWKLVTMDPQKMNEILQVDKQANVLLLLHGIIGDMQSIIESLKEVEAFSSPHLYVLAYDYENLSEPIGKTALLLHNELTGAGFGTAHHAHTLSIVAHSMGGLVSRCLIEKEGGHVYVQQLVMVGTPNGGSEIAALKQSAFGLLTHALNVTGALKLVITGISFLLKKMDANPWKTLDELTPDSEFMVRMENSVPPTLVPYHIIAGDTGLLKEGYEGDDYFLKKIGEALMHNLAYPALSRFLFSEKPNDLAVTLESMQRVTGFDKANMHTLASDHISYYTEDVSRKKMVELMDFLK